MTTKTAATVEDLARAAGKAEIVDGRLFLMSPSGARPGRAALRITVSLTRHEDNRGGGFAFGDNVGFLVQLPQRQSFSPDAAWHTAPIEGMGFVKGAPAFAAEVRSEGDYGPRAEAEIAAKRRDYFAAGTTVVWDVDLLGTDVVRVYVATNPDVPRVYRRGDLAEAEPAVPGWRMTVDELFR